MSQTASRRNFIRVLALLPGFAAASGWALAETPPERRVSGPFVHENLAIYLVHGPSTAGQVPLTLAEAMARGKTHVYETDNVSELSIENVGDEEVFVQAGDIVKGGKQDRVLTVSLVLPARSGKMPIAAYCVEQGRWNARGREDATKFATSQAALPSREAKLAMKVAAAPVVDPSPTASLSQSRTLSARVAPSAQNKVWDSVSKTQDRLARSIGASVAARESQTSMQLTLENAKLKSSQTAFAKALADKGTLDTDVVGYVFAVNGKINSADLYPSNGLFRKMWGKNFDASVTEALAARADGAGEAPSIDAVLAFLDAAERGRSSEREINKTARLETREADAGFMFETRGGKGGYAHRNYLAK